MLIDLHKTALAAALVALGLNGSAAWSAEAEPDAVEGATTQATEATETMEATETTEATETMEATGAKNTAKVVPPGAAYHPYGAYFGQRTALRDYHRALRDMSRDYQRARRDLSRPYRHAMNPWYEARRELSDAWYDRRRDMSDAYYDALVAQSDALIGRDPMLSGGPFAGPFAGPYGPYGPPLW